MDVDRAWIERLKVDPANVAAQLVALTNVSDWARGMHRENFDGYLIAAAELLTRPTPDGEIGELVAYLHDEARSYAAKLTPMTVCAARDDGYRPPLPEETTFWKAATALETQAADITRLREAASESRIALDAMMNSWFDYHDAHSLTQPVTGAAGNAFDLALAARDRIAELLDDTAALATRTDVR